MGISDTFKRTKAAEVNPKTFKIIEELQEKAYNCDEKDEERVFQLLDKIKHDLKLRHEINECDPSILSAVTRLVPSRRDKSTLSNFIKEKTIGMITEEMDVIV